MDRRRAGIVSIAAAAFIFALGTAAHGATITVNSLADPSATGACTLHDAIVAANTMIATNGCAAGTGDDTIQFNVTGTILLGNTLPEVTGTLTINGPASPGITIDGDRKVRVLEIALGATVHLDRVTIAHGVGPTFPPGGGISNIGTLTITRSTFSGNSTTIRGGGIFNSGTLTVVNSTFSGNIATGQNNGLPGLGGGIFNSGTLTVVNSTFSGNIAARSSDGTFSGSLGCAIFGGSLSVTTSTFAGNNVAGGCTGIDGTGPIKGTILAQNGRNCAGPQADAGYNISDDGSCVFAKTGSANNGDNIDPLLSPAGLADNGGPTQTIALQSGSPAIDAIPIADCTDQASPPNQITTDQRGFPRSDAAEQVCDIGAYEFQDVRFAGQPGKPNCRGKSVSALVQQFGDLDAAARRSGSLA